MKKNTIHPIRLHFNANQLVFFPQQFSDMHIIWKIISWLSSCLSARKSVIKLNCVKLCGYLSGNKCYELLAHVWVDHEIVTNRNSQFQRLMIDLVSSNPLFCLFVWLPYYVKFL